MFLKGSEPLVLPEKQYLDPMWIEAQYTAQREEALQLRSSLNSGDVEATLSELHGSVGGVQFIGKELRSPLLREMLYESVNRNLLQVYKLSQGESAEFFADIEVAAAAIGVSGLPGQLEIKSDYTRVDTRMFVSSPFIRWNTSNLTKFDIVNATQQRMKASLMFQEAAAFVRLLQYASGLRSGQGTNLSLLPPGVAASAATAASNNAPLSVPTSTPGKLSVDQVATAVANFGSRLIRGPKKLYINPQRQADLVLFNFGGVGQGGNGFFAPNTQEILLNKGNIGNWLGCEVYEDIVVPPSISLAIDSLGNIGGSENVIGYILGPAEFVGVQAIRTDLVIETMKDATRFADVFAGWMDLGFYIRFVKAIQRLTTA